VSKGKSIKKRIQRVAGGPPPSSAIILIYSRAIMQFAGMLVAVHCNKFVFKNCTFLLFNYFPRNF